MLGILSRSPKAVKKLKLVSFQQPATANQSTETVGGIKTTDTSFKISPTPVEKTNSAEITHEGHTKSFVQNGPRVNPCGIQMLPQNLFHQLFNGKENFIHDKEVAAHAVSNLKKYGLKCDSSQLAPEVDLKLPSLEGKNIEEHFLSLGKKQCEPYKILVQELTASLPEKPSSWELQSGWTKYSSGKPPKKVPFPDEDAFVIDVEVCKSAGEMPTLAIAASPNSWYGWVSPALVDGEQPALLKMYSTQQLIPLESSAAQRGTNFTRKNKSPCVAVGHNVMYDRSRFKEQYWLDRTGMRFVDTMSLHICVSGITSYQKAQLLKAKKSTQEDSLKQEHQLDSEGVSVLQEFSSLNSLAEVYNLYCGEKIDKTSRDLFIDGTLKDIRDNFQSSMSYCASDVSATHKVLSSLFPLFLERFPHPVTFAGMLEISLAYLPVNSNWDLYIKSAEQTYQDLGEEARFQLARCADEACGLLHNEAYRKDLWMWDQDWSLQELKLTKRKSKTKSDFVTQENQDEHMVGKPHLILDELHKQSEKLQEEFTVNSEIDSLMKTGIQLPVRPFHLPGYPAWYRKLCVQPKCEDWSPGPQLITTKMQLAPKLLRLTWENYPLYFIRGQGWGTLRPSSSSVPDLTGNTEVSDLPVKELVEFWNAIPETDRKYGGNVEVCKGVMFQKLPHKNGPDLRVGDPLGRDFIVKFSENVLSGDAVAEHVMDIARKLSYWRNNRDRIMDQLVVWVPSKDLPTHLEDNRFGVILPQLVVCGTLTRRAVERTWMTASNISQNRSGSELRAMVQAPPGYCIVGADVDSQELWIASLIGDAYATKMHGGTPFGWMTISGRKSDGTDMHSVTAKAVGISRDHAKVINYARIYGAGVPFAHQLLKQFNPSMTSEDARRKALKMFAMTKGQRCYTPIKKFHDVISEGIFTSYQASQTAYEFGMKKEDMFKVVWSGGTESAMFNRLEEIAHSHQPKTPFLEGRLSRALETQQMNSLPTRINWVVQSGAVDFLHLLLVAFRWLEPEARFCLSFHDEVRYLVPEDKAYRAALALHAAHLLTRAFCASRLGLVDLPYSVAFFTSVEVDKTLRKEAHDDCTTPSNSHGLQKGYGIPLGECLDIYKAIDKAGGSSALISEEH